MNETAMTRIAVVFHSTYGHTERLARAVADGARSAGDTVATLIPVDRVDGNWNVLESADAIVFGAPTYMGSASAGFKTFMESSSKVWVDKLKWRNKLAAGFTCSQCISGDKLNTLISMALFAAQHGMQWVGLDLYGGWNTSTSSAADLNRIGTWLGVAAQANGDQTVEVSPPASDILTAEHLGRRVATLAKVWVAGTQNLAAAESGAYSSAGV